MGQDTVCNVNVSYTCDFTPENYELIAKLIEITDVSVFTYFGKCDDEVVEITDGFIDGCFDDDNDMLNINEANIINTITDNYGYKFKKINKLIFSIKLMHCNVRNISRRSNPTVHDIIDHTPISLTDAINNATMKFTSIGINQSDVNIDFVMSEY